MKQATYTYRKNKMSIDYTLEHEVNFNAETGKYPFFEERHLFEPKIIGKFQDKRGTYVISFDNEKILTRFYGRSRRNVLEIKLTTIEDNEILLQERGTYKHRHRLEAHSKKESAILPNIDKSEAKIKAVYNFLSSKL